MTLDFINHTDFMLDTKPLECILHSLTQKSCELLLVKNDQIQQLNEMYRNKNQPTDVLSFPLEDTFTPLLGSIVISLDFVAQYAQRYQHSEEEEIALLFIHGLLHLLGYNHEEDNGEHRLKEEELIKQFNLPKSLIIRNET